MIFSSFIYIDLATRIYLKSR